MFCINTVTLRYLNVIILSQKSSNISIKKGQSILLWQSHSLQLPKVLQHDHVELPLRHTAGGIDEREDWM